MGIIRTELDHGNSEIGAEGSGAARQICLVDSSEGCRVGERASSDVDPLPSILRARSFFSPENKMCLRFAPDMHSDDKRIAKDIQS
jgi:hypothetical protein